MVNHICDLCAKEFKTKSGLDSHKKRKTPCSQNIIVENEEKTIRYIDLFSGLGAFHTAFNASPRFKCVLACDINEGARRIYEANYGIKPEADIRSLNIPAMPEFDLLCAGFPCQSFSIAGNGLGFQDEEKGNLFFNILDIIDARKPPMCILENVKNLETHDDGKTYATIKKALQDRGYTVTSKVLNAAHYGSPQARQRIFIVATLNKSFSIPEQTHTTEVPVNSIIDESDLSTMELSNYNLVEKTSPKRPFKPHILYDVKNKKTNRGGRQGERVYDTAATGITVCASSGGPGAKTGLYKVKNAVRRLSVKETLKMFGFPETYKFPDLSSEESLFYLGNSIVVNVISAFIPAIHLFFSL